MAGLPVEVLAQDVAAHLPLQDAVRLALANRALAQSLHGRLAAVWLEQAWRQHVRRMLRHVADHPPYRVVYVFRYRWTVSEWERDGFCFVVQRCNRSGSRMGYLSTMGQPWWRTEYLAGDEVAPTFDRMVLPVIGDVVFKACHDYKRKRVQLVGPPQKVGAAV